MTDRELILIEALREILENAPSCVNDDDCPLNGGEGFDSGCGHCFAIIAKKALERIKND